MSDCRTPIPFAGSGHPDSKHQRQETKPASLPSCLLYERSLRMSTFFSIFLLSVCSITLDGTTIKGEELSTAHSLEDGDYREEHFTFKGQSVSNTEYERLRNQFYAELTEIANAAVYVPLREIYDFERDFLDEDALIEKLCSFRSPADREAADDPGEADVEFENLFPRLTREEQYMAQPPIPHPRHTILTANTISRIGGPAVGSRIRRRSPSCTGCRTICTTWNSNDTI